MMTRRAAAFVLVIVAWLSVATPALAIPPGVEANGETFGPAACSDGVTRTFVHQRGLSTWSTEDGTKWKLLLLTVGGASVFKSGNSTGLYPVVDCTFGTEVSTTGLVRT